MTDITAIARAVEARGFPFLTWDDWYPGGRPDLGWTKLVHQAFPATRHWVHHSVTSATTSPREAAADINAIGIARFGKMSYPFLIHHTGAVIQGCYPYIGAHTKSFNSSSLAGCNIGNYETTRPTDRMVEANAALIRALRDTNHYADTPTIEGHRQSPFASTSCPGRYLMAQLPRIVALASLPVPTPSPPSPTGDDDMFTYTYKTVGGTEVLVLVASGKQTRLTGNDIANRRDRAIETHLGLVGADEVANFAKQYGPILGAPQ